MTPGFGGFSTKMREARKGRNPATGMGMIRPKATEAAFWSHFNMANNLI